ncbi:MAG: hypothetical protein RIB65_19475 [Ilumatobacter fluminis]
MVDALSCRPPGFGSVDDGGLDAIPPGVETATFAPLPLDGDVRGNVVR